MIILEVSFLEAKSEKVKARADVIFEDFTLKGFKVLEDNEKKKLFVTPPSYKHISMGWRPLFKTNKPEDWQEIQRRILEDYEKHLINDSLEEKEPKRKK